MPYFSSIRDILATIFTLTYLVKVTSYINIRFCFPEMNINIPESDMFGNCLHATKFIFHTYTLTHSRCDTLSLLIFESDGQLRTSLYDKRDDFNFHITNFPFLSSNIPSSPAYGVFISQLIRYARACSSYECFILRAARLSSKLLGQGYVMERLKSSLRKFYGRYGDLIKQYEVSLSQMLHDILGHDHIQWHTHWSDITPICELITELDLSTDFDLITKFWRFP